MRANTYYFGLLALRVCLAAGLLAGPVSAKAGWKGYLSLEGFKGESQDKDHVDWSEITGFSEASSVRVGGGAWPALGKPTIGPLAVTRVLDQASPSLYAYIAQGQTIGSAVLDLVGTGRSRGGQAISLLKIELKDVLISSITTESGSDGVVSETLVLNARSITANSVKISVGLQIGAALQATLTSAAEAGVISLPLTGGWSASGTVGTSAVLLQNLLRNPGAEASEGSADLLSVISPLEWRTTGGLTALRYSALSETGNPITDHGSNLFSAGPETGLGLASQVVDVSPAAAQIDAGKLRAILSGWLGSKAGDQDAARLKALFRDTVGEILGSVEVASTPTAGHEAHPWLEKHEAGGAVPSGTRSIEVVVELQRYTGIDNAGIADDLSLTIEEIQAQSAGMPVRIQVQRFNESAGHPSVQFSWLADAGAVAIESADQVDGTWRPESPLTELKNGQRTFEVPIDKDVPVRFWRVRPASSQR